MITRFTTFIVLFIASLLAVVIVISPDSVPTSRAQGACGDGERCPDIGQTPDPNVDSSLNVTYRTNAEPPQPIQPVTGTSWKVSAKYVSTDDEGYDCVCATADEEMAPSIDLEGTFNVDWNGTAWVPSAQAGFTGPLNGVDICSTPTPCNGGGGIFHSSGYKIHVNLDNPLVIDCPIDGPREFWLDQVLYTTTAVDNGRVILPFSAQPPPVACSLGAVKNPQTQIFQVGDNGEFECNNSCPFGPSLVILYSP